MEYICNARTSPEDKRDYIFVGTTGKLPDTLDYRKDLQIIRNQGNQGTCYAQSAACIKEWQEFRDYGYKGIYPLNSSITIGQIYTMTMKKMIMVCIVEML